MAGPESGPDFFRLKKTRKVSREWKGDFAEIESRHICSPMIKTRIVHKVPAEGEGFAYVLPNSVAHLVLLTPGTAVMHSCPAGKPGEMAEIFSREDEGFLSSPPENISEKRSL